MDKVLVGIFPDHDGGGWDICRYTGGPHAHGFDFDQPLATTRQISPDDVLAGFEWGREQCRRNGWQELWRAEV